MSSMKEYIIRTNSDTTKKEIVELIRTISSHLNNPAGHVAQRTYNHYALNKMGYRKAKGTYAALELSDAFYDIVIRYMDADDAPTNLKYTKILERKSPIFKIKNQIITLYKNKELQNYCKVFGGQYHQTVLQCLLYFAKN